MKNVDARSALLHQSNSDLRKHVAEDGGFEPFQPLSRPEWLDQSFVKTCRYVRITARGDANPCNLTC